MARSFEGATWRRLRAALRREQRQPCWLCRQPINYDAPKESPDSFSADHILPVSTQPDLALIYTNLAAAHLSCNKSRQDKMPALSIGNADQQW